MFFDFVNIKIKLAFYFSTTLLILVVFFGATEGKAEGTDTDLHSTDEQKQRITIDEYQLVFTGNNALSEEQLRSSAATELEEFKKDGLKKSSIDDAAFQMELLYRRNGFAFATVTYTFPDESGNKKVQFLINEGPAVTVDSLELTGNQDISREILIGLFQNGGRNGGGEITSRPFIKTEWSSFVNTIRELYLGQGFLDVQIQGPSFTMSEDRSSVVVAIHILEGLSYHLEQIRFSGVDLSVAAEPLQNLKEQYLGTIFFPRMKITLKNRITEILADAGFAEVAVRVTTTKTNGLVHADADIKTGPIVTVGEIIISGNERTRENFIRSRLSIETGKTYNLGEKQESFYRLYRTGLFSSVQIDLMGDEDAPIRPIAIRVNEVPAREVYFEPGWGSYELARFVAGYRDRNIFGSGKSLRLDGGASLKGRHLLLGFTDPWLLGHNITLDLPFYYSYREEPSYTEEKIGSTVQLNKRLSRFSTFSLGYFYESNKLYDIGERAELTTADDDYVTAGGRAQLSRDTRDDIFFPSSGYKGNVMFKLSDPVLGGELSYARFLAGINYFLALPRDVIVGMRWKTGFILPGSKDNTIPLGERFFNGGENTVRSFKESELGPLDVNGDPIGGTAYNVFSVELRRKLGNRFAGSLFIDVGNIVPGSYSEEDELFWNADRSTQWRETFNNYFSDMRMGIGGGLQYLLPIGPLRLDIAFNPDKRPRERAYAVHFSIGMAF